MSANRLPAIACAILSLFLSACSDQKETAAHQRLQQDIAAQSGGALTLSAFNKTNGYEQDAGGMKVYTIEWQARLNVETDVLKRAGAQSDYWQSFNVIRREDLRSDDFDFGAPIALIKGATIALTGESLLQKTENGWRVIRSVVNTSQLFNAAHPAPTSPEKLLAVTKDANEVAEGKKVFVKNCAPCHGPEGGGVIAPNLTDDYWIHGGRIEQINATITTGVVAKGMPPWGQLLPPREVDEVTAYAWSLHGTHPASPKPPQGVVVAR